MDQEDQHNSVSSIIVTVADILALQMTPIVGILCDRNERFP